MDGMNRYVALLRGINVGGHHVRMDDLKARFEELGLQNVRTYIQSGNVFFESAEPDTCSLTRGIERRLEESLGYEVAACLRTIPELELVLTADPFKSLEVTQTMRLCVVFCSEPIPDDLKLPMFSPKKDIQILKARGVRRTSSGTCKTAGRPAPRASWMQPSVGGRRRGSFTRWPRS